MWEKAAAYMVLILFPEILRMRTRLNVNAKGQGSKTTKHENAKLKMAEGGLVVRHFS